MKVKAWHWTSFLALGAFIVVLAACGAKATPTPTPRPPTATPVPPTATPTPRPAAATATPTPAPAAKRVPSIGGWTFTGEFGREGWDKAPKVQELYQKAKADGAIRMFGMSAADTATPLCAAFEKRFPGVKCEFESTSAAVMTPKFLQEYGGGQYVHDVVYGSPRQLQPLLDRGYAIDPGFKQYGVDAGRLNYADRELAVDIRLNSHKYNTNLVKPEDLPKTYEDFKDPKWKGELVSNTGMVDFALATAALVHNLDWAKGWYTYMIREQQMVVSTDSVGLVARGEKLIEVLGGGQCLVQSIRDKLPCGEFFPDVNNAYPFALVIPEKAPHPNAAMLFALFMASEESSWIIRNGPGCECAASWPGFPGHAMYPVLEDPDFGGIKDNIIMQGPQRSEDLARLADEIQKWRKVQGF